MDSKYKITYTRAGAAENKVEDQSYQEVAASVSEVKPYQYGKNSSKNIRERKSGWTKLILTILSAVFLSAIFGLVLLQIFSPEREQPVAQDPEQQPATEQPTQVESGEEADNQAVELGGLSGYVIQAGAFQELEQAELTQANFLTEGYATIIWETDTDYRVFLAVYRNEQDAKYIGGQLTEAGFDVYAREWQSPVGTISGVDSEWLIEFRALWQQSLTGYSETVKHEWDQWSAIDQAQLSDELSQFYHYVAPIVTQLTEEQLPFALLDLWYAYTRLIE